MGDHTMTARGTCGQRSTWTRGRGLARRLVLGLTVSGLALGGAMATTAGSAQGVTTNGTTQSAPTLPGGFDPVTPFRLLDTRTAHVAVPANSTVDVPVAGRGGVPWSGAGAVALTLTAVAPKGSGYLTVYPKGASRPIASNVNFLTNTNSANGAVVGLGTGGSVTVYNGSGAATDVVLDLGGYALGGSPTTPGGFTAVPPTRVLDTRQGTGTPLAAGATRTLSMTPVVPTTGVSAVLLNVTAVGGTQTGYVTAYASTAGRPATSSLNWAKGQTVPNLVVVPVGTDGRINLYNGSGGTVHLLADVAGYYSSGSVTTAGGFSAVPPARLLDTRQGTGAPRAQITSGATLNLKVTGGLSVPDSGVAAVVLNLTVPTPRLGGFLTAWAANDVRPTASNVTWAAGRTQANLVVVPVNPLGRISLYNGSGAAVDIVGDVLGYYLAGTTTGAWTTSAIALPDDGLVGGDVAMARVSCASTTDCVGVGSYQTKSSDTAGLLASRTSAGWVSTKAALPSGGVITAGVQDVSCFSSTTCVALGQYSPAGKNATRSMLLARTGTTWSSVEAPRPDGADANALVTLSRVTCPANGTCIAVGSMGSSPAGARTAVVETFDGTTWTATPLDTGGAIRSMLTTIACPSPTWCLATGTSDESSTTFTYDGTTWTPVASTNLAPLSQVVCPTVGDCTALGQVGTIVRVAHFTGGAWSLQGTSTLVGTTGANTYEVGCSGQTCIGVGLADLGSGNAQPLQVVSGASSLLVRGNVDPNRNQTAVACSTTRCVSVGRAVETFENGRWTSIPTPSLELNGTRRDTLTSVTCPTSSGCVAVGTETDLSTQIRRPIVTTLG